jgi:ABC-type anion transport system duplicated permease subunit
MAIVRTRQVSLGGVIWVIIGVIVAANHHFFTTLKTVSQVATAIFAVLLWPLIVLHIHITI